MKPSSKIKKVMHEWKTGTLHSGGPKGPVVKSQKQAVAIALSEAKKAKATKAKTTHKRTSKRKSAIEGK